MTSEDIDAAMSLPMHAVMVLPLSAKWSARVTRDGDDAWMIEWLKDGLFEGCCCVSTDEARKELASWLQT